jgi:hypothetical protein
MYRTAAQPRNWLRNQDGIYQYLREENKKKI